MPNAHPPKPAHKVFLCLNSNAFLEVFCINVVLENSKQKLYVAMFLNLMVRIKACLGGVSLK